MGLEKQLITTLAPTMEPVEQLVLDCLFLINFFARVGTLFVNLMDVRVEFPEKPPSLKQGMQLHE